MKSVLLAYVLWFLGGPLGLYKFYLGRPCMGLFYVFTCGGLFLGWIGDFFTLPYQVQVANVLLRYQSERPTSALRREIEHCKGYLYTLLQGLPILLPPPGAHRGKRGSNHSAPMMS